METGFTAGFFRGVAHLVDIKGNHLGGFRFEGASSKVTDYTQWKDKKTGVLQSENANSQLGIDLMNNTFQAMTAELKKLVPGAVFNGP